MELNNRILAIKQELKRQKISYEKLSTLSGIPVDTLKKIFSGRAKNPRIDTVEAIEQAIYFNYEKKPIAERQASDLADNFIKEFGEYFSEQNFIKLAKLYKVMSAEQALIAIGWIAGMLEQSGVKVKNIL